MIVRQTDRAPVVLQAAGLWFPEPGLSFNSYRPNVPAIIFDADILRANGRKTGVLAPESLWERSFPHAKVAKSPLPVDRGINLGDTFIRVWPAGSDAFHLVLMADETIFVSAPVAPISVEDYDDLGLEPPSWIVWYAGPGCGNELSGSNLNQLGMNWPGASILLYGPEVSDLLECLDQELRNRSQVLSAAMQAKLF